MAEFVNRIQNARTKLFRRHTTVIPSNATPSPDEGLQRFQQSTNPDIPSRRRASRLRTPPDGAVVGGAFRGQPSLIIEEATPADVQEVRDTVERPDVNPHAWPPTPWSENGESHNGASYNDPKRKPIRPPLSPEISRHTNKAASDYFGHVVQDSEISMARRKVWIKRPGASATLVQVSHDDVVDDVRDMVLRKYANSLGRTFDAPDVTIRIIPRERTHESAERTLSPEEPICRVLDSYYPGAQAMDEALLIDVPHKRTPRQSPRIQNQMTHYFEDNRPVENEGDYFPPMPAISPNPTHSVASEPRPLLNPPFYPHSMTIVETGQLPALPSPREKKNHHRPRYGRQHTSSPTIISSSSAKANSTLHHPSRSLRPPIESDLKHASIAMTTPPLPTPPPPEATARALSTKAPTPPLDRVSSPRPGKSKKVRKTSVDRQRPQAGGRTASDKQPTYAFLEGIVPPINVLIVEDNPINLRLLEMFAKRLKVRWQTAMNGRDAVIRWRTGGFHLVLMDIQLPIMSGLEATKEIRRLERVNGIGVFAKSEAEPEDGNATPRTNGDATTYIDDDQRPPAATMGVDGAEGDDKLTTDGIFKSPVIIVALTASSLQSDRHEALAAGCNDFLTKPVSFPWLERKVMEWGCMQALIDFDGWRKWKDLAADEEKAKAAGEDPAAKARREKRKSKMAQG